MGGNCSGASRRPWRESFITPAGVAPTRVGFEAFHASGVAYDVRGARGEPALACAFRGGDRTWTLALRATGEATPAYAGELRGDEGVAYAIRSVHHLERSPLPLGTPAGFEVAADGANVAMIEILGPGRV